VKKYATLLVLVLAGALLPGCGETRTSPKSGTTTKVSKTVTVKKRPVKKKPGRAPAYNYARVQCYSAAFNGEVSAEGDWNAYIETYAQRSNGYRGTHRDRADGCASGLDQAVTDGAFNP
jgi:hypothetical protein